MVFITSLHLFKYSLKYERTSFYFNRYKNVRKSIKMDLSVLTAINILKKSE